MKYEFDESEVRKALTVLVPEGNPFEVRFISGKRNWSGYFVDHKVCTDAIAASDIDPNAQAYFVLNPVVAQCYYKSQHDKILYGATTTSDDNIASLSWMFIDLDAIRPSDTSSTDEQLEAAKAKGRLIYQSLKEHGWHDPVIACSGNGIHLLYHIGLQNTKENVELVKNCLKALDMIFSDDVIHIDCATGNPARICKLYGTVARKGMDTPVTPHRMAKILYVPDSIQVNKKAYLDELAERLPKQEAAQRYNGYAPEKFDLQTWIDSHGLPVKDQRSWGSGTKWILEECPFDSSHKAPDASIIQTGDGKICFNCFHNSCADKRWKDLRLLYEPDAYSRYVQAVPRYQMPSFKKTGNDDDPVFWSAEAIRNNPEPEGAFIPTGIKGIDDKLQGLRKGYVSILSGLRSAGKSSLLSELVLNAREADMTTLMVSGEMSKGKVMRWIIQQAAGAWNVKPTQYERVFYPIPGVNEQVSKWLGDKFLLYNNDKGLEGVRLVELIADAIEKSNVDLVLLDNLMAMDIESLDKDAYVRQKKFIWLLKEMAQQKMVHVMLVCHPRKTTGYLRLEDISGSGDLANTADEAFIIHRVNNDYKARTKEMYGWKDSNPLYEAGNVIEICKDRDYGWQDEHTPLFFEIETKRLKNHPAEAVHYGWEPKEIDMMTNMEIVHEETPWEGE